LSEPVRHTPTAGLFPPNSQNVAEILTRGVLSRDIPFVGRCLLSQKRLLASTEAKVLPRTPLRESISRHEGPHLASNKIQAALRRGTARSQGEGYILSSETACELK